VECAAGVQRELGVYRKVAKAEDRARWLSGVRTSLEKDWIGWTMWDYSGGFGLVAKVHGQTSVDEMTVTALRLKVVGTN
jgi:endoglucanase